MLGKYLLDARAKILKKGEKKDKNVLHAYNIPGFEIQYAIQLLYQLGISFTPSNRILTTVV